VTDFQLYLLLLFNKYQNSIFLPCIIWEKKKKVFPSISRLFYKVLYSPGHWCHPSFRANASVLSPVHICSTNNYLSFLFQKYDPPPLFISQVLRTGSWKWLKGITKQEMMKHLSTRLMNNPNIRLNILNIRPLNPCPKQKSFHWFLFSLTSAMWPRRSPLSSPHATGVSWMSASSLLHGKGHGLVILLDIFFTLLKVLFLF
jgi:hypothetical protein